MDRRPGSCNQAAIAAEAKKMAWGLKDAGQFWKLLDLSSSCDIRLLQMKRCLMLIEIGLKR